MFKTAIISSLLICISSSVFAELSVSEKIRPQITSLVNPNIQRLDIPPTPNNMSLPSFGQGIIGWGTGPDGAENRLNNITKDDVEKLKTQNVTLEMIQTWQKFYENETNRNAGNPTAPLRAKLMKKIIELW
ncbi:DUF4951 domain-containing protein [Acinetobacter sp. YIM 103518]|uniref:DUF4951 domain-containing protein n=1 Tax=Acinetobacter faecalis TaxID=2665161 RepID=A0A6L6GIA9_9GAMM|nr:DUF4951 domain-containing protein [Acinetobacter faecalis]MTD12277.1 DUF4951 domain-containing protein [Acinetobacter faecalis]